MGCGSSQDPLLADIYSAYEQKYDFEQIFPTRTDKNASQYGTFSETSLVPGSGSGSGSVDRSDQEFKKIITDDDIDVHNNNSNLSSSSDPIDILIDINNKTSKTIIRLNTYNGSLLLPIIKLGMNESKNSPDRDVSSISSDNDLIMCDNNGLLNMEYILSNIIRRSGFNDFSSIQCPQNFFPNDIKSMIISFYSFSNPKLQSFRLLINTAIICKSIFNLCEYIGSMLNNKLLEVFKNLNPLSQELIISADNASICRQLIFLFHYILSLDQYKMSKQQPLTNNFTAYKRMHSEFINQKNFGGGGFNAFNRDNSDKQQQQQSHTFTEKELLPLTDLTNIAMFMGKGSTACIDTISESMKDICNNDIYICILSEFCNGCLTLLRANGNNKQNRNIKIVKYSLYILRAIVSILLIIDYKKSKISIYDTVFGSNETQIKTTECVKMITNQFLKYYSDDISIKEMQGCTTKDDIIYHIKYCKRIIKYGSMGAKNNETKRSIQNMLD